MTKKSDYRLRITHPGHARPWTTYIVRKGDRVSYISSSEEPLSLSNLIHDDAACARFVLEDVSLGDTAATFIRATLADQWKNNPALLPTVTVLS